MPTPSISRAVRKTWSNTLKLPRTTFPARARKDQLNQYLRASSDELYTWQREARRNTGRPFILHDGPPYANGELHIGHALNKILKDIICRVQLGRGRRVRFIPGWDCHGLPIELKAVAGLQEQVQVQQLRGEDGEARGIRRAARKLAEKTVRKQIAGFREFGVMADWENHWKTMDRGFEKRQLGVFREMVDKGLIYRRFKPVYWSPSTRTALAEAEVEYKEDHVSTAALVRFPLVKVPERLRGLVHHGVSVVIWTTTPWTIPANGAIAVREDLEYTVVKSTTTRGYLIVAQSRLDYLKSVLNEDLSIVASILGSELVGQTTYRPLFKTDEQPVIAADFVTAESGSGIVHCAPGHGMEDYEVCLRHGISAVAPVNDRGQFTDKAMPSDPTRLTGKSVLDEGNTAVLEYIDQQGQLLSQDRYQHKYPYDWRSRLPIIIRATEQWFADVGDIRGAAIRALEDVRFIPESGKRRLENFVKNRSEWCISRQRAWGVPIPVLFHRESGDAVLTKESVSHIMSVIDERGVDAWWTDDAEDPAWIPPFLGGTGYTRGTDTMDVWFDSGTSWTEINSGPHGEPTDGHPADVYIEGTDQHRGWFQSGLLTFTAHQLANNITPRAPFKNLITHGFTLDESGRKMSKSLGNVVSPQSIMDGTLLPPMQPKAGKTQSDALGPDALRMWVAGTDYTQDVIVGQQMLQTLHTTLHKYRVTFKLLIGALADFQPEYAVPYVELQKLDRIALMQLSSMVRICQEAYDKYEFYRAVRATDRWANIEFSSFYVESIKDRLYTYNEDSKSRRAVQTTLFHIYTHLQELLAPITPLLVEETWAYTPEAIRQRTEHPLKRVTSTPVAEWMDPSLEGDYQALRAVQSAVKSGLEVARSNKQIGSSLQAFAHVVLPGTSVVNRYLDELADMFVVSSVTLSDQPVDVSGAEWTTHAEFTLPDGTEGSVQVYPAAADKCERCWRYAIPTEVEADLCGRCAEVVQE